MKYATAKPSQMRKGVFYLVLPLIIVPLFWFFADLFFPESAEEVHITTGLNQHLPDPILDDAPGGKSEAYSFLAKKEEIKVEDNWSMPTLFIEENNSEKAPAREFGSGLKLDNSFDPNASAMLRGVIHESESQQKEELQKKMQELEQMMDAKNVSSDIILEQAKSAETSTPILNPEIEKLQAMMNAFENQSVQKDPEIEQLEQLVEKLLDLQYPERVREKNESSAGATANKRRLTKLYTQKVDSEIQFEEVNGFFGLETRKRETASSTEKSFKVVVHENQEISPGQSLRLRLLEDLHVGDLNLPKGSLLNGNTQLAEDRLLVNISGVFWEDRLFPLSLEAFSMDAIAGIALAAVKGGVQILEQTKNQAMNFNVAGLGMGLEADLANAGLNAGRGFLRSKRKPLTLSVKAGYPLILLDYSQN